jgi:uncharacterized protein (TIGR03663 family)
MNRWSALTIALAVVGALAFRLPRLDIRPLHNDEAVNAFKATELWRHDRYVYDPDEYHGPTLHYATLPALWLSGAKSVNDVKDRTLRLAPVVFGAALILLLFLFIDGLGWQAAGWSALFIAISPAMVFYSRYFIHEMLLVFFTALALGAGWRYYRNPSARWAITFGIAVGLMFATKETFVLSIAGMVFAAIGTAYFGRARQSSGSGGNSPNESTPSLVPVQRQEKADGEKNGDRTSASECSPSASWKKGEGRGEGFSTESSRLMNLFTSLVSRKTDLALAAGAALVVWLLFFSSFFTHFAGLLDSIRTYFPWLKRAAGHSPHLHPWYFYLQRLGWFHSAKGPVWSEGLILVLAAIASIASWRGAKSSLLRFLTFYTAFITIIYSAISYKTPWCLLSFLYGMILLAGVGAASLVGRFRSVPAKVACIAVLFALSGQLAAQSWRTSFVYYSDRRNPYVYAQTVPDVLKLVERVEGIGRVSPADFGTVIKVMAPESDYWPLPWYLRRFPNIGWYEKLPDDPFAPIIIVSSKLEAQLDEKSARKWIMAGLTELRPGRFFELYVELDLWKKYVETLPPPAE